MQAAPPATEVSLGEGHARPRAFVRRTRAAETVELPDRGGQWPHWHSCRRDGVRLTTVSPTAHRCPKWRRRSTRSVWLIPTARGYSLVRDTLAEPQRKRIA